MKPVVYLDILFLINFLMDSVIIYTASLILKRNIHILRLTLSAGVSALYSAAMFFPQLSILCSLTFKLLFMLLPTLIAFPSCRIPTIIKNTLVCFAVYAIFGGVAFALIFATGFGTAVGAAVFNGEIYISIPPHVLVISTLAAYLTVYILSRVGKKRIQQERLISNMEICFDDKATSVRALSDTGCTLTEPLSGNPVIIINRKKAEEILPSAFPILEENKFSNVQNAKLIQRFRIIPFRTVDSSDSIMHGFVPDSVCADGIFIQNTVIGIAPHPLSEDAEYDAIFNPDILKHKSGEEIKNAL